MSARILVTFSALLVAASAGGVTLVTDLEQDGTLERIDAAREGGDLVLRSETGDVITRLPAASRAVWDDGALRFADVDGDGLPDLLAGDTLLFAGRELAGPSGREILGFTEKWNTGGALQNVWDSEVDDLDSDGAREIVGQAYYYPGTLVRVFENGADDHFAQVWASPQQSTPSIVALDTGETDGDMLREVIAGEAGTLGRLYLWENTGDDTFEARTLGFQVDWQVREIQTADTDGDGAVEIIAAGSSSTDGGSLKLFEHSGAIGDNVYTLAHDYDTVSYLFGCKPGDADNDGKGEVLLEVGGWPGYPTYIRRLEHNPSSGTWEHKLFEATTTGLPISGAIADLDGDEENELVLGSNEVIYIYESYADDTFTPVWTSPFAIPGNVMDLAIGPDNEHGFPTVVACSFEGQVDVIGYDGITYARELAPPLSVGDPLRSADFAFVDGTDPRRDLVLARSGSDLVSMFEELDLTAADWEPGAANALRLAAPNPFRPGGEIRFAAPAGMAPVSLRVYDVRGRLLRILAEGASPGAMAAALWNGQGADGEPQASGVYLLQLRAGSETLSRRIVLLR